MELYALEQNNPEPSKKVLHLSSNALSACPLLPYSNGDHYSACPWTAACKALRACFWGQLATLWGPPQRKQRRGLEFVVEAPELFDEDDSFLWTGFTRQAGSVHFRHVYQAGIPIHSISSSKEKAQRWSFSFPGLMTRLFSTANYYRRMSSPRDHQ